MKAIKLESVVFLFDINGSEYKVSKPTVSQIKEYSKNKEEFEKAENSENAVESIDKAMSFLEILGLPKEVSEELQMEHLEIIIEKVMGNEKKK